MQKQVSQPVFRNLSHVRAIGAQLIFYGWVTEANNAEYSVFDEPNRAREKFCSPGSLILVTNIWDF